MWFTGLYTVCDCNNCIVWDWVVVWIASEKWGHCIAVTYGDLPCESLRSILDMGFLHGHVIWARGTLGMFHSDLVFIMLSVGVLFILTASLICRNIASFLKC